VVPWAGLRPMMPNMMPRVGRGKKANVFYNTGHGHLGWTLSAVTADMVAQVIAVNRLTWTSAEPSAAHDRNHEFGSAEGRFGA
jgi:glycine/D-amino acid oxidase-like deaminating enzyme